MRQPPALKPVDRLTPQDLAFRFSTAMQDANRGRGAERSHWIAVGAANHAALAKNFKAWLNDDGVTREQIVAMIDIFVGDPRNYVDSPVPAWKAFLNSRQMLAHRAANRARAASTEGLGWQNFGDDQEPTEPEGLGWKNFGVAPADDADPTG